MDLSTKWGSGNEHLFTDTPEGASVYTCSIATGQANPIQGSAREQHVNSSDYPTIYHLQNGGMSIKKSKSAPMVAEPVGKYEVYKPAVEITWQQDRYA